MIKNLLVSAGVALLVVVLGFAYFGQPELTISSETLQQIVAAVRKLGAFPGPDITDECISINGARTCTIRTKFLTGSSTNAIVAIHKVPSGTNASSTLVSASCRVDGKSTSTAAQGIQIFSAADLTGTTTSGTTILGGKAITATGTIVQATTTALDSDTNLLGGPSSQYIIYDYKGAVVPYLEVNNASGYCTTITRE